MQRKPTDDSSPARQTQGSCLRKVREERGWSQAELARQVGVSTKTVMRWEGNLAAPHPYASQKLCNVLGKTREELALGKLIEASADEAILETPSEPLSPNVVTPPHPPLRRRRSSFVRLSSILVALLLVGGVIALLKPGMLTPFQIRPARTHTPTSTTPRSKPAPYPPGGWKLVLSDPLNQPLYWQNGSDPSFGGACQFSLGAYYIVQIQSVKVFFCTQPSNTFSNLAMEVKMTIIFGDCGGIWFNGYYFSICQNGFYSLQLWGAPTPRTLVSGPSSAIHTGLGQSNLLAVLDMGNHFTFYVNHQQIASKSDSTYRSGQVNLGVTAVNGPTEVAFTNVKVWTP